MMFRFRRPPLLSAKKKTNQSKERVSADKIVTKRRFLPLLPKPISSSTSYTSSVSAMTSTSTSTKALTKNDPVESVLSNMDLMSRIINFLPQTEIPSLNLVSKDFQAGSEKVPLKLRIEDRGKNLIWYFRPSWRLSNDGKSDRDEILYPFYKIGSLPTRVRKRVTELTLVMRMVDERLNDYHLESMVDILKDFTNLEYLRVLSSLNVGDSFCSLFQHKNYFQRLRTVLINGYCLDNKSKLGECLLEEPWLWKRVTGSNLKDLVEAAPNIEHLEICSRAGCCNLNDLLPLSRSLRAIRFYTGDNSGIKRCVWGDVDAFLNNMPLLESWDFLKLQKYRKEQLVFGARPASHNKEALSYIDPVHFGSHTRKFMQMADTECQLADIRFFKRFVAWFFTLRKEDKDRSEIVSLLNIAFTYGINNRDTRKYKCLCKDNIGVPWKKIGILYTLKQCIDYERRFVYQAWEENPRHGRKKIYLKSRQTIYMMQKHSKYLSYDMPTSLKFTFSGYYFSQPHINADFFHWYLRSVGLGDSWMIQAIEEE